MRRMPVDSSLTNRSRVRPEAEEVEDLVGVRLLGPLGSAARLGRREHDGNEVRPALASRPRPGPSPRTVRSP